MDLNAGPEYIDFRNNVLSFIEKNKHMAGKARTPVRPSSEELKWQKKLIDNGYAARTIPKKYGGYGAQSDVLKSRIIAEEFSKANIPMGMANQGISMLVPTLLELGSDDQKNEWINKTILGEVIWCQGYSEPGSGSDLASLQTKAIIDGDDFIINGQKIWTSGAQIADMMFCLVRTEPEATKHKGISYILIDMKTPGIEVKPIITLDGDHEVNEIWFDNVRVPKENVVGEVNQGWTYAKFLLTHERSSIAGAPQMRRAINRLAKKAENTFHGEKPLSEDSTFKSKVAQFHLDLDALEMTELRGLAAQREGRSPGAESSLLKIKGTDLQQRLTSLAVEVAGHDAMPYGGPYGFSDIEVAATKDAQLTAPKYLNFRKVTIYGGSNEIQKNIIAKAILGL